MSLGVVGANCVVSGVRDLPPGFRIPPDTLLQQTQLCDGRFVCVMMGVRTTSRAYCAAALRVLSASGPTTSGPRIRRERSDRPARPSETPEDATRAALLTDDWLGEERMLADILQQADRGAELAWRNTLRDHISHGDGHRTGG